jgi:hypothetical protein
MAVIMEASACFPPQVAMQTGQALCLAFLLAFSGNPLKKRV